MPDTALDTAVISAPNYSSPALQYPTAPAYTPLILTEGGKAADMNAQVTRATWEDYRRRFVPMSDALIASTGFMNPSLYRTQVQDGINRVNSTFNSAFSTRDVALSRYGLGRSADQRAYDAMQDNVTRSASIVDAANRIRQKIKARDMNIALGGTGE